MVKESKNETKKSSVKSRPPSWWGPQIPHSPTCPIGKCFYQFFVCPFRHRLYIHMGCIYILSNITYLAVRTVLKGL